MDRYIQKQTDKHFMREYKNLNTNTEKKKAAAVSPVAMDVGLSVGFLENKEEQYDPAFYLNRISNNNSLWKVTQKTGGSNYLTRRKTVAVGEKVRRKTSL